MFFHFVVLPHVKVCFCGSHSEQMRTSLLLTHWITIASVVIVRSTRLPPVYPACSSDSDCYDHPLYRCVGCRYNASLPAGHCYGTSATAKATCQCMASAPGDQCTPSHFKPDPASALPTYMMVGDSISLGMVSDGALFTSLLNGTVQAAHSPGNACNANRGAHCIAAWLDSCAFDIVSFNFGIHDIAHNQEHLTLDVYEQMLGAIVDVLESCRVNNGTKLLYVLTTPVPSKGGNASSYPSGDANDDVVAYNEAAARIMHNRSIPTLDLYSYVVDHCGHNFELCDWMSGTRNVHPSPLGFQHLAAQMASAIKQIADGTAPPLQPLLSAAVPDGDTVVPAPSLLPPPPFLPPLLPKEYFYSFTEVYRATSLEPERQGEVFDAQSTVGMQYWSLSRLSQRGMVSGGVGVVSKQPTSVLNLLTVTNFTDTSARGSLVVDLVAANCSFSGNEGGRGYEGFDFYRNFVKQALAAGVTVAQTNESDWVSGGNHYGAVNIWRGTPPTGDPLRTLEYTIIFKNGSNEMLSYGVNGTEQLPNVVTGKLERVAMRSFDIRTAYGVVNASSWARGFFDSTATCPYKY